MAAAGPHRGRCKGPCRSERSTPCGLRPPAVDPCTPAACYLLPPAADVRPCYHWLFRNPAAWGRLAGRLSPEDAGRAAAAPGAIPAPPAAARDGWPASLRALCNRVESRRPVAEPGVPQGAEEFAALSTLWPKRQRTQL